MAMYDRVLDALKQAILLNDRVVQLSHEVRDLGQDVRQLDRRVTRLETIVEVGTGGRVRPLPERGGSDDAGRDP